MFLRMRKRYYFQELRPEDHLTADLPEAFLRYRRDRLKAGHPEVFLPKEARRAYHLADRL
jgi:hypothetical protein